MNFKFFISCFFLLFLIIMTSGTVVADEAPAMSLVDNGTVSGDVVIYSSNPFTDSGSLEYTIPVDVSQIQSVDVIVSSYSGSGAPTYALYSNITLNTVNGLEILGYEDLYCDISMTNDPTVYKINDHTTKQFSDYQSTFDITDKVKNLSSGDTIKISVKNTQKEGYNFDGRIKLIALVFAYDDGDNDKITYWLNVGQSWTQSSRSNLINTKGFNGEYDEVTFENIALSSYNSVGRINNELLYDPIVEKQGSYFIYDKWDITDNFEIGIDTNYSYKPSSSGYGSFKSVVQLLKVDKSYNKIISTITPEYKNTIYAGVSNNLTMEISSKKDINAVVKLYNNKNLVFSDNVILTGGSTKKLYFVDSTIRPVTSNTAYGENNKYENYSLVIEDLEGNVLNSTNVSYVVLYNGNLGKDYEYPAANPTLREFNITGDVIVLNTSEYGGSGATTRNDIFNVDLADGDVSKALLYVSYNWDKVVSGDFNTWNTTFNNQTIVPVAFYRDQSNLGTYGKYGYGLIVYDVTELLSNGANTFELNKIANNAAVYPSNLILLTNNDGSVVNKTVYILEEADLLSKTNNKNLPAGFNTTFEIVGGDATLYVFAAGAQKGEGNLIINDKTYSDVWSGTSQSFDMFISSIDSEKINVYFESTGSTILGLHQMVIVEQEGSLVINAPEVTKYFKGPERFVVNITTSKGYPVANQTVNITINGETYTRTTNENGTASIPLGLNSGVYNVTASIDNTTVQSSATILSTINGNDLVKIFRNATQYYATFLDSEGNPLASGTEVTFNINGVMYNRKTNEKGTAKLNINLGPGTYILTAINPANGEMQSNVVTVLPNIVSNDLVKYYRNASQYVVTVLGEDGKAVGAGENVTFNINGVFYTRTTNASGQAKLNINLGSGNYIITAVYNGCSVANNITVLPVLTAEDLTKKYGTPDQFVATLVDGQGKPYANQNITFNVHGVFYTRTTNGDGQAKLNINLQPGEYIITSTYEGCNIANTIKVTG
ncbi:DUF3344 domain-containing protein [Methanobrevibacter sp.]|uniref:DUF3344 domain-containing protein n=1 Tax=Methanobrevibacter sp. TaxID=66852 RepID=UPI0038900C36